MSLLLHTKSVYMKNAQRFDQPVKTYHFDYFLLFFFYWLICFCRHECNVSSLIAYEKTIKSHVCIALFSYNFCFILLNAFCKFVEMYIVIIEKKNDYIL